MTMMFRLAATKPARLTSPVGPAAPNRPHDVALVQTVLKLKQDGKGQPYYSGRIDGWFSSKTQAALAAFQQATAPGEANRPMDKISQSLRRLAETKELLAKLRGAAPFTWRADWVTEHKATMRIVGRDKREWIRKL